MSGSGSGSLWAASPAPSIGRGVPPRRERASRRLEQEVPDRGRAASARPRGRDRGGHRHFRRHYPHREPGEVRGETPHQAAVGPATPAAPACPRCAARVGLSPAGWERISRIIEGNGELRGTTREGGAMLLDNWKALAVGLAAYLREFRPHILWGALPIRLPRGTGQLIGAFGNDGYTAEDRVKWEVSALRWLLGKAALEELGFGLKIGRAHV